MAQGSGTSLKPGELLKRFDGLISHWGVYTGKTVVHFVPDGGSFGTGSKVMLDRPVPGTVREDDLEIFRKGHKIEPYNISSFTPEETIKRARNLLGQRTYQLSVSNCEHFATSVAGDCRSLQVESAKLAANTFLGNLFRSQDFSGMGSGIEAIK
ncbi:phospholipase A and acyltransferase 3-like [Heterodontus francisci]|uniref:phospholipase A and acyltransferase 3-like n=1 Tax=Heterodontus francisci TaxID=7792 RepID=UPI00355AFE6F